MLRSYWLSISSLLLFALIILSSVQCDENIYIQGERLYVFHCGSCHMDDGSGLKNIIPDIRNSRYLDEEIKDLPCLIRHGKQGFIVEDSIIIDMPVNYKLTEYEINNIINYLMTDWEKGPIVSITTTRNLLDECPIPDNRYGQ